ncbi:MAG: hypothetical protein C3F13_05555 [Anaerolineales bacterium]|nr:DUF692 family protein [Anaerolineae bacterium]PWB54917.1 MAG: hypothetical protein C3F13_05555 [Anaerolineales bacterium]
MNLAINYSPPAARLLSAGNIRIDLFKTPDWNWLVDEALKLRPVAVHFTLDSGNGDIDGTDWEAVADLLEKTRTPFVNLHLDSRRDYYPDIPLDSTRSLDRKRITETLISDVTSVVERFGCERVIVENSPYRVEAGSTLRACVEPEIITQVVEETGCGLLLDISHVLLSAYYMGMAPEIYFSRLPVRHIKELHFAGVQKIDGVFTDHLPVTESDWVWLDWGLEKIRSGEWSKPWLLAFEYGGVGPELAWRTDTAVINKQVPQLIEHLDKLGI